MISNLYKSKSLHSLFRKSQATIFAITFFICTFLSVHSRLFLFQYLPLKLMPNKI